MASWHDFADAAPELAAIGTRMLATLRLDIRQRVVAAARHDERIRGLVDYGSSSEGRADAFSCPVYSR